MLDPMQGTNTPISKVLLRPYKLQSSWPPSSNSLCDSLLMPGSIFHFLIFITYENVGMFWLLRAFKMGLNENSQKNPNKINQGKKNDTGTHLPLLKACFLTQILSAKSWPAGFPPPVPATQALQSGWASLPAASQEFLNFRPMQWPRLERWARGAPTIR